MKLTKMAIMKVGSHTAMDGREINFTTAMLDDLATHYEPELSEAPIVIGHPTLTAPAYGWVKQASVENGTLYAHVGQVDANFAEAVNAGRYKKRSASIFLPDTPGNPKPGHYYLRHVGFLGAVPPAVKSLADVNFAQSEGGNNAFVDFAFDDPTQSTTQEKTMTEAEQKAAIEAAAAKLAADQVAQREADFAAREDELKEREQKVQTAENAQRQAEQQAQTKAATDFADQLVKDGKLLPAHKAGLVEVMVKLGSEPVSFSDGSQTITKSSLDVLKDVLNAKAVDFAEKSGEEGKEAVDFADSTSIAKAATAYQAKQAKAGIEISMTDAVNHVMQGAKK
ncbi:peptidase [Pasteurella multocida]|uniref:peptidase n=1 Tax=Pasteurella multocida TaxID=747 RepID=UPI00292D984D|nr:peptidase [Pasteurella multocida]WNY73391.1 peptidase [Pasteurella multocida]WVM62866.1 peptidase [Pasteurella multocida]